MEKKKITNSSELNNFYNIINNKLKKFADMEIPHNKIAAYLRPGTQNFNDFINEDDDLKEVDGIEIVLKDIIEDRMNAFRDGLFKKSDVKTFENYLINESIFSNLGTTDSDINNHERALADIYRISISSVDSLDKEINLYSVKDDNNIVRKILVYTSEQIGKIKEEIVNILVESTKNKHYSFGFNDSEQDKVLSPIDKKVPVKDIVNYDKLKEILNQMITEEDVVKTIARNTGESNLKDIEVEFQGKRNLNHDYYLFEIVSK